VLGVVSAFFSPFSTGASAAINLQH
jgi:hypothetical protein